MKRSKLRLVWLGFLNQLLSNTLNAGKPANTPALLKVAGLDFFRGIPPKFEP